MVSSRRLKRGPNSWWAGPTRWGPKDMRGNRRAMFLVCGVAVLMTRWIRGIVLVVRELNMCWLKNEGQDRRERARAL